MTNLYSKIIPRKFSVLLLNIPVFSSLSPTKGAGGNDGRIPERISGSSQDCEFDQNIKAEEQAALDPFYSELFSKEFDILLFSLPGYSRLSPASEGAGGNGGMSPDRAGGLSKSDLDKNGKSKQHWAHFTRRFSPESLMFCFLISIVLIV